MEVEINFLGVIAATIIAMVIGGLWYSPLMFGKTWQKLAGLKDKDIQERGMKAMAGMVLLALVTSYVLAHVTYLSDAFYDDVSYGMSALTSAFWMWLGFVLYGYLSTALFEQKPRNQVLINLGNSFITLLAMGIVIGLIGV